MLPETRLGLGEFMFGQDGVVVIVVGRLDPATGVIHGLVVDPSADRCHVMPAGGVLTARQVQVAELVARGLSNKDIATKLMISQRTAEGHVENILAKLGCTSRTQLAVWFTENQW